MDALPKDIPRMDQTLECGLQFNTATDALHAIQDYALKLNKSVKVTKTSGMHRYISCSCSECAFFVLVYRQRRVDKTYGSWYISSMNLDHINCTSTSKPTRRQVVGMPSFACAVQSTPSISASSLITQVQIMEGVNLQKMKRSVYRAKDMVKDLGLGDIAQSYQKIPSFLSEFQSQNPGSYTKMEKDENGHFVRAIVLPGVFIQSVSSNQQIFGVDCAHSKCSFYTGVQMLLVGRDGNMENMTVAVALVSAENYDNYSWFFTQVMAAGVEFGHIPVFCDRNTALLSVASLLNLNLKYCTLHILRNAISSFKTFSQQHKNLVWQLQAAESEEEYNSCLARIGIECGDNVSSYLRAIDPSKWCVFSNIGNTMLYGWRTSNFVESEFGTEIITGIRELHPYAFFERICSSFVDDCYKRSQNAILWDGMELKVTPAATKLYNFQSNRLGEYAVQHASTDVCYVSNVASIPPIKRRVNLNSRQCTCGYTSQFGIPCRHIVACLESLGKLSSVFDLFDSCYTVPSYSSAFSSKAIFIPLSTELSKDTSSLPAKVLKKAGRPKKKRIRSNGEEGVSSTFRCSKCYQSGHNKRTCTTN
jgi:hypothetical protein